MNLKKFSYKIKYRSFDSNFPICHVNDEEATRNNKKAVGVSYFGYFLINNWNNFFGAIAETTIIRQEFI